MNIELKDLSETRKSLVVTLEQGEVDAEHKAVVKEIAGAARIPGFRPGRAPADLVLKRFAKEVRDEFKSKVVGKAYRDGVEKAKIDVANVVHVEEGVIEPGLSAAVTFTIDVQPQFELPEYVGLPVQVPPVDPADADIDAVIERLRQERAAFSVAARPARRGDFVKLAYEGTVNGRPVAELAPEKQIYAKVPLTWEEVESEQDSLIPGLGRQLGGLKAGDKKNLTVTFPAGFAAVPELAGKSVVYAVDVQEVRERVPPPLDAEFFKSHHVETLDALRQQVRENLRQHKGSRTAA